MDELQAAIETVLVPEIQRLRDRQRHLEQKVDKIIMTAIEDLKTAQANLDAVVVTALGEIQHFIADVSSRLEGDSPDLGSVVADLNAQAASLGEIVNQVQAADATWTSAASGAESVV